jgi:hypothetical protein
MNSTMRLCALSVAVFGIATPAFADEPAWLTRCNRELNKGNNDPETGNYIFQTRGKDAGAASRANFDYNAKGSANAAVYPTAAKDLMNPYGGASVSIGYFIDGEGKGAPTVGQISMRASARDYKPIPGGPVEMKLVIDGKAFGPYPYKPSADSDGMYSVWLDTAEADGDSKPPILKPADFAALAKAADAMKTAEVVFAQGGADIVKMPVNITKRVEWRDGLAPWAKETKPRMSATGTDCASGDKIVN